MLMTRSQEIRMAVSLFSTSHFPSCKRYCVSRVTVVNIHMTSVNSRYYTQTIPMEMRSRTSNANYKPCRADAKRTHHIAGS